MLRAGVTFSRPMKLLGHTSPDMTMQYLDVTLKDLQLEFDMARSKPRHLVPQPAVSSAPLRAGFEGLIDSLLATQHVLEIARDVSPHTTRRRLSPLPRPALQSAYQNHYRSRQTPDTMKTGRHWPVMSVLLPNGITSYDPICASNVSLDSVGATVGNPSGLPPQA